VRRRHPPWERPSGCLNQCSNASRELADELKTAGIDFAFLWFTAPRGPREREHPDARRAPDHLTVDVGGEIIDLTRRQWDNEAPHPTVYPSLAAAGADWQAYYPDSDERKAQPVALTRPAARLTRSGAWTTCGASAPNQAPIREAD
jgi:hypothetical protein